MAKKLKITANKNSNMYDIAKAFGTTVDELKKYNNLDSNIIKVGQELFWETDDVQGVKDRMVNIEKIRLANEAKKNQTRYDPKIREEQNKKLKEFTKEEDYGDLTQHQIRDYQNFKKMGLGKTVEDFKTYKQNESKSAQATRDNALKLGTGVMAGATASALASSGVVQSAPRFIPHAVKFAAKQLPWMAGSYAADAGLDAVAGDDPDSWANNRYVRGGATAIGMVGGNVGWKSTAGVAKHGLKYLFKAFKPMTQNALGELASTTASVGGMTAAEHAADTYGVENPYLRTGLSWAGMVTGSNLRTAAANKTKAVLGNQINNLRTKAFQQATSGQQRAAIQTQQQADKLYNVLDKSVFSKALDVKGSNTMPMFWNTVSHIPVGAVMQGATLAEDVYGTDILHDPIIQGGLLKGAGATYKGISNKTYNIKKKTGGAGDVAQVVQNISKGNKNFTGTYGTRALGNGVLEKWFPGIPAEKITDQMINQKYQSLSPTEKAQFIGTGEVGGLRSNAKQSNFDTKSEQKGYIDQEHGKGINPMMKSTGFAYEGITQSLPLNFTPEQFYSGVASKASGRRHGFGYKYGVTQPKNTVKENFKKTQFVDSKGNKQPVLVQIGNRYIFHPEFKADMGFRGQDTFLGVQDGNAWYSNIAGHVGTIASNPTKDGSNRPFKIGIDTPGYGDTSKRYKGASQTLGTIFGKGLDYYTPRPAYTVFGEYKDPNGKIFGTTTNVQTGGKGKVRYKTIPTNSPTGMIPLNMYPKEYSNFMNHLKGKQNLKAASINKTQTQQNKTIEQINNYNTAKRLNQALGTSFIEGQYENIKPNLYKSIRYMDQLPYNPKFVELATPILAEQPYKRNVKEYSNKLKMLSQAYDQLSE